MMVPRNASRRSFSRPPSRLDLEDEQLLVDSTTGITVSSPGMAEAEAGEPYQDQPAIHAPVLPPLNLSTAIAYNSAHAKVVPQFSQAYASTTSPPPRAHKSSFSVPPSSRAVNTFSVVDTNTLTHGSEHGDSLHARAANYETLLRQFSLRRTPPTAHDGPPHPTSTSTAATSAVPRPSRSTHALLQRTSSAEERRFTLTRLGSSFTLDRIRRRSNGASSSVTQALDAATSDSGGVPSAMPTTRPVSHRVSLARSLRRGRHRVAWTLGRMLLVPLLPRSIAALVRQWLVLALLVVQCVYLPFAPSFLAPMRDVDTTRAMICLNCALEIAWLLDVLLQFNTAVAVVESNQQQTTTDRKRIAVSYFRGAFVLDALSALPLETVACWMRSSSCTSLIHTQPAIYYTGWALRVLVFRRVASCVHAIQQSPLGKWLTHGQYRRRHASTLWVATELMSVVVVALHYLACAWHAMLMTSAASANASASTVVATGDLWMSYALALVDVGRLLLPNGGGGTTTSAMLAGTVSELHVYVATLVVMLLGVALLTMACARLTVAFLFDTLLHHERDGTYQREKVMAALDVQMAKMRLPRATQDRVRQYYTLVAREYGGAWSPMVGGSSGTLRHGTGNTAAMCPLSAPLTLEIALWRYTTTLGRMPLWKDLSADLLSALVTRVEPRVYLKDDFVRRKGEIATELLVVQRGTCEYMATMAAMAPDAHKSSPSAAPSQLLAAGASLGALPLLVDYKSSVYVRATSHVEVAVVPRDVFTELLNRFVEDRERLVRRILQAALESGEHAALWHVVHSVQSSSRAMAGAACGATSSRLCAGSARTMAHLGRVPRPSNVGGHASMNSDRRVSTREAAKILLRVLGIYALPPSKALYLPLCLDPEALRSDRQHQQTQSQQPLYHQHHQRPSSCTVAVAAGQPFVTTRSTASLAPVTSAEPSHLFVRASQSAMAPATTISRTTTDPTDLPDSRVLLDELAQTQAALLHLVQNLTDAITRLDSRVGRMEERVHRADDSARYHHGILRRRGSNQDRGNAGSGTATSTGRSTSSGVLPRRRNSYAAREIVHGDHREHDDDDGHSDRTSSYDWLTHAPRLLPPEEIAVLRTASGLLRPTSHRSAGSARRTRSVVAGGGGGGGGGGVRVRVGLEGGADSHPASSSPASKSPRVSEIPVVSTVDDDGGDVYNDTAALATRGVDIRGQQLTSRSTPLQPSRATSTNTLVQMTSWSPQLLPPPIAPKRARSLSTNTRRRLALVQQALGRGGTSDTSGGSTTTTSTTTVSNSSGSESSLRLTAVSVDLKRRASLSTMMWTRAKAPTHTTY